MWISKKELQEDIYRLQDKLRILETENRTLEEKVARVESKLELAPIINIGDGFFKCTYEWDIPNYSKDISFIKDILKSNDIKYVCKKGPISIDVEDTCAYDKVKSVEEHYENPE